MWFEEFQDGRCGGYLDIRTERFKQSWISKSLRCLPSSFNSIQFTVWKKMLFEEFQDGHRGSHLGYRTGRILAIPNFYVPPILPIKFQLNPTYTLGGLLFKEFQAILDIGTQWFINSKSLCHSNAFYQVLTQSNLLFWKRCHLKIFKMATVWPLWQPPWILERNEFSNSESQCSHNASHQNSAQSDIILETSKMWKANDGRTTDNRPWYKLTWSKAPGELTRKTISMIVPWCYEMTTITSNGQHQ